MLLGSNSECLKYFFKEFTRKLDLMLFHFVKGLVQLSSDENCDSGRGFKKTHEVATLDGQTNKRTNRQTNKTAKKLWGTTLTPLVPSLSNFLPLNPLYPLTRALTHTHSQHTHSQHTQSHDLTCTPTSMHPHFVFSRTQHTPSF